MLINHKKLNPNAFYLLKYLNDATLRFIILYGGSSSSKSFQRSTVRADTDIAGR